MSICNFIEGYFSQFTDRDTALSQGWNCMHDSNSIILESDVAPYLKKYNKTFGGKVNDICEREVLVSLLGSYLNISVVPTMVVDEFPHFAGYGHIIDLIRNKCVLMHRLCGSTLSYESNDQKQFVKDNCSEMADIFAFMLWIGDEDKGLSDVMFANGRITLIDNGVSGPGQSSILRSAHPSPDIYRTKPDSIIKMCWHLKQSFVGFVLRNIESKFHELFSPSVISRIERFSYEELKAIADRVGLKQYIANVLFLRSRSLHFEYQIWLAKAIQLFG